MNSTFRSVPFKNELITESLLEDVVKMDYSFFPNPWSQENWKKYLDRGCGQLYCIFLEDQLIGLSLFELDLRDSFAHLHKIVVNPKKRGLGLGLDLLKKSIEDLEEKRVLKVYLEVNVSNFVAIELYEKLGFKRIRVQKGFYSDGSSAAIMTNYSI